MGDIMRVIKRIMVFVSLLLITYFVFYVAVPAFIISGGIKPSAEKAEKIFYRDRDIIVNVKNYIAENNYENIHIDEEDGKLYIYPENIVIDNKAKNQLQTLIFDKHYRVIGNDEDKVYFQIWSSKDRAVGFIFCPDGNAFEHGYTVQIKNLGNGWYLYEEDFANWKRINEEKVG